MCVLRIVRGQWPGCQSVYVWRVTTDYPERRIFPALVSHNDYIISGCHLDSFWIMLLNFFFLAYYDMKPENILETTQIQFCLYAGCNILS